VLTLSIQTVEPYLNYRFAALVTKAKDALRVYEGAGTSICTALTTVLVFLHLINPALDL
jgi:hypothetical protein